jgi:hypothetical protein
LRAVDEKLNGVAERRCTLLARIGGRGHVKRRDPVLLLTSDPKR